MTERDVEQALREHRANQARVKILQARLYHARKKLALAMADAAVPAGQVLDGMPRGTSIGDPTAKAAVERIEGDRVMKIQSEIQALERELDEARFRVKRVNAYLKFLPELERAVVEWRYVEGRTLQATCDMCIEKFNMATTLHTVRRVCLRAVRACVEVETAGA